MPPKDSTKEMAPAQLKDKAIYVVGPRRFQNELMAFFIQQKTGAKFRAIEKNSQLPSIEDKEIAQPILILLDCFEKDLDTCLSVLGSSRKSLLDRYIVALFDVSPGMGIEEKALRKGIRGFFYKRELPDRFLKGIDTMFKGELWASRELMTKSILENRDKDIITRKDTTALTQREIEILSMVAFGAKNEQIADKLFISPNTVKTHVYNIFKKISVPNRLQAALWAAKNL